MAQKARAHDAAEAWADLVAPVAKGDAVRIGAIGVTGSGKTTAVRDLLARHGGTWEVILVDDQKLKVPEFDGEIVDDASAIFAMDLDKAPRPLVLVVRRASLESTAAVALRLADAGVRVCLVIGELSRAVTDGGRELTSPSVRLILLEGRARGASLIWTTQLPQRAPSVFFDQSRVLMFNPGKKARGYLERVDIIGDDEVAILPSLAIMESGGVGEFIVAQTERDWNGVVYAVRNAKSTPPPTVKKM